MESLQKKKYLDKFFNTYLKKCVVCKYFFLNSIILKHFVLFLQFIFINIFRNLNTLSDHI